MPVETAVLLLIPEYELTFWDKNFSTAEPDAGSKSVSLRSISENISLKQQSQLSHFPRQNGYFAPQSTIIVMFTPGGLLSSRCLLPSAIPVFFGGAKMGYKENEPMREGFMAFRRKANNVRAKQAAFKDKYRRKEKTELINIQKNPKEAVKPLHPLLTPLDTLIQVKGIPKTTPAIFIGFNRLTGVSRPEGICQEYFGQGIEYMEKQVRTLALGSKAATPSVEEQANLERKM